MRRLFLIFALFLFGCKDTLALEIVYPKTNPANINAPSTFFIGSVRPNEKLKINDTEVKVAPSGAFVQTVPLNIGTNNFKITAYPPSQDALSRVEENYIIDFAIIRAQPSAAPLKSPTLTEYPVILHYYVTGDNAPLRMTPVDGGINRMAHLSSNIRLLVDGESGNFYRVYLNSKLHGWIAKSDIMQCLGYEYLTQAGHSFSPTNVKQDLNKVKVNENYCSININKFTTKEDREFLYWEFELNDQAPYILKEENGLTLQIFNVCGYEDNTYKLNIPVKKLIGYEIGYDNDKLVLKVRRPLTICPDKPLNDIKIALDAGHGGSEFGAIGGCGDKEKDINLAITKELQKELELRGAKVIMTRDKDEDVSLKDRVKTAKEKEATLLISIHANALPDSADPVKCRGTSIYYYHDQAKSLADCILNEMTTQLGTQNDKVRQGSLALVRPTASVSVLIEVAYIINPDDYALLLDKTFQTKCAKAIADGIGKFLLQN